MAKPDERKVTRARRILGQKNAEKPAGEDSRSDPRRQAPKWKKNDQTETGEHRETEGQRENKEIPESDGEKIRSDDRQFVELRDEVSCRRSVRGMWQSAEECGHSLYGRERRRQSRNAWKHQHCRQKRQGNPEEDVRPRKQRTQASKETNESGTTKIPKREAKLGKAVLEHHH